MSEGKDICYGCGVSQQYGTMKDMNEVDFDIYCDDCFDKIKEVEHELKLIYQKIGIDTPRNHDKILDFVYSDVNDCADKEDWHSGDVAIAFSRFLQREEAGHE